MDYPNKDQRWVFHEKTEAQETAPGVVLPGLSLL